MCRGGDKLGGVSLRNWGALRILACLLGMMSIVAEHTCMATCVSSQGWNAQVRLWRICLEPSSDNLPLHACEEHWHPGRPVKRRRISAAVLALVALGS